MGISGVGWEKYQSMGINEVSYFQWGKGRKVIYDKWVARGGEYVSLGDSKGVELIKGWG